MTIQEAPIVTPAAVAVRDQDTALAREVQGSLRRLARHCPQYAAVFTNRAATRLAAHVISGDVECVSHQGRDKMSGLLDLLIRSLDIEPGLDTNTFVDRLTGRVNPRIASS